jgi:hypothetical protein
MAAQHADGDSAVGETPKRQRSEGAQPNGRPKAASYAPQPNGYANGSEFEYRPPPPHNLEAERALLGAILIDNKVHSRVADFVYPVDFFDPLHQQIFETAARLIEAGQRADPITLKPFFEDAAPYLGTLVQLRGLASRPAPRRCCWPIQASAAWRAARARLAPQPGPTACDHACTSPRSRPGRWH